MLTALQAQCDSAVSVCPQVFDRLIIADVQVQSYKMETHKLRTQINLLSGVIDDKNNAIIDMNNAANIDKQMYELQGVQITGLEKILKKEKKRSSALRFGIVSVGIAGSASTLYFMIR